MCGRDLVRIVVIVAAGALIALWTGDVEAMSAFFDGFAGIVRACGG